MGAPYVPMDALPPAGTPSLPKPCIRPALCNCSLAGAASKIAAIVSCAASRTALLSASPWSGSAVPRWPARRPRRWPGGVRGTKLHVAQQGDVGTKASRRLWSLAPPPTGHPSQYAFQNARRVCRRIPNHPFVSQTPLGTSPFKHVRIATFHPYITVALQSRYFAIALPPLRLPPLRAVAVSLRDGAPPTVARASLAGVPQIPRASRSATQLIP
mmetsp:Transcript_11892/g.34225  ORF Transcript_11892/g.34225 Transcript_11892/m.34225 type:complete len:214 (+) Transcript_11892:347-988(+)